MEERIFKCGQCGRLLNSEKELREHEQTHVSQGQRQQAGGQSQKAAGQGSGTR